MEDLEDGAGNLVPEKARREVETAIRRGSNRFSDADSRMFSWETDKKQLGQREGL